MRRANYCDEDLGEAQGSRTNKRQFYLWILRIEARVGSVFCGRKRPKQTQCFICCSQWTIFMAPWRKAEAMLWIFTVRQPTGAQLLEHHWSETQAWQCRLGFNLLIGKVQLWSLRRKVLKNETEINDCHTVLKNKAKINAIIKTNFLLQKKSLAQTDNT